MTCVCRERRWFSAGASRRVRHKDTNIVSPVVEWRVLEILGKAARTYAAADYGAVRTPR